MDYMYYKKRNQIVCKLLALGSNQHTSVQCIYSVYSLYYRQIDMLSPYTWAAKGIHFCFWRNSTWLFGVYQKTQSLWLLINLDRSNCQEVKFSMRHSQTIHLSSQAPQLYISLSKYPTSHHIAARKIPGFSLESTKFWAYIRSKCRTLWMDKM